MEPPDLRTELARLHPLGFAWAVRCCRGDRADAEDVLHLAYVKVLEGRARFGGRSAFRTWFFGVVKRTALEQARRRWLGALRLDRWTREREPVVAPTDDPGDDETAERLHRALGELSRRQQEVLHLVFYQEMTIQEAADVLGVPVGTARTHYERGKARLRRLLDPPVAAGEAGG
jgi:RNA polymerase sigma-70 factor (ECF subfamily)